MKTGKQKKRLKRIRAEHKRRTSASTKPRSFKSFMKYALSFLYWFIRIRFWRRKRKKRLKKFHVKHKQKILAIKRRWRRRRRIRRLSEWLKKTEFGLLPDFFKWKAIDIYRCIRYSESRKVHIYGIWCFVGLYGGGKTMSLVHYLERMHRKYGDKIYISTNFFYTKQDFPIRKWEDLIAERDKPVIFAYDELQNEFNSRDYRNFPITLMTLLTQNRKGNGKQIVYTTQDYEFVDKNFRRLTQKVVVCRTFLSRLTSARTYDREDYEYLISTPSVDRKIKIRSLYVDRFIQTDYLRGLYDSYAMLESAKSKEYNERVIS